MGYTRKHAAHLVIRFLLCSKTHIEGEQEIRFITFFFAFIETPRQNLRGWILPHIFSVQAPVFYEYTQAQGIKNLHADFNQE